jgi:hypothetical protein
VPSVVSGDLEETVDIDASSLDVTWFAIFCA